MHSSRLPCLWRQSSARHLQSPPRIPGRGYSSSEGASAKAGPSRHAQFYSDLVPGMIPVALLGSAVYLGLRLLQADLAHEKYLDEAQERVKRLEEEVYVLQKANYSVHDKEGNSHLTSNVRQSRWWFW